MTLVLAPVLEEGAFRLVLYGWLRRFMALFRRRSYPPWPLECIMEIGFKAHTHFLGMVLAWGYEGSEYRRYPMAVLMHGAANLAVLAAFG